MECEARDGARAPAATAVLASQRDHAQVGQYLKGYWLKEQKELPEQFKIQTSGKWKQKQKNPQAEGILETENLDKQTETTDVEDMTGKIKLLVKENV